MSENKTNLNTVVGSPSSSGQVKESLRQFLNGQSFYDVLDYVNEMVEIECFDPKDKQLAESIVYIIAEVLILPEDAQVRISGHNLSAKTVSMIFLGVTHEHIAGVIRRFREADYKIKHIKTYLRTALYNSFFEFKADNGNFGATVVGDKKPTITGKSRRSPKGWWF